MNRTSACTAVLGVILAACGGGAPAAAPKAHEAPEMEKDEPRTIAEAQDQIDAARIALDRAAQKTAPAGAPGAEAPADSGATKRAEKPEAGCAGQCRALASMKRAVDALCRMTGDGEGRCVAARRTFEASATRVESCGCNIR